MMMLLHCYAAVFFVWPYDSAAMEKMPRIAIIIDDMGYDLELNQQALALPGSLTYSFLPDAPYAARMAEAAYAAGREVMLHAPMESIYHDRLQGVGVRPTMSATQIQRLLERQLRKIPHVQGVNNHMGSYVTQNAELMRAVMRVLRAWPKQSLYFVDSMTTPLSVAGWVAKSEGLQTAWRHVFLDHIATEAAIHRHFDRLLALARQEGQAIAIAHPRPQTLAVLQQRLSSLSGVELVSMSDYWRDDDIKTQWAQHKPDFKVEASELGLF